MAAQFTGTLNTNEFYSSLYNMIRLMETYADSLSGLDGSLASEWRQDGGMFNDTSVYTSMDIISSRVWDPNDTNVLAPEMRVKPYQEKITVDKKRQIGLYNEEYLSKRAWMAPENFFAFQSVVNAQVSKTKRLYDALKCNVYAGTTESAVGQQTQTITFQTGATQEETNRLEAQDIAKKIADVFVGLEDATREYNDREFMDAFNKGDFKIIWNADFFNKVLYTDLPTIYHKEDLIKNGKVLPGRFFGNIHVASATADGSNDRALDEYKIRVDANGDYDAAGTAIKNVYPGDLLPQGTPIVAPSTAETTGVGNFTIDGKSYALTYYSTVHAYAVDAKKICKIVHKNAVKFLSSFQTETEFWNPKALSTNRYLTWMFADPERLSYLPYVSINEA